jgi:hypothetical protein
VGKLLTGIVLVLAGAAAVLCLGPWYHAAWVTPAMAVIKLLGIGAAAVSGWWVFARHERDDPQRRAWLLFGVGLALYACGQSVLAYHQIILRQKIAFPSLGDPFFVLSAVFIIGGLVAFSVAAARSGLPLGSRAVFWRPALVSLVLFALLAYPLLAPVVRKGGAPAAVFLNVYYPVVSFLALAPCLVLLRVGLKFRGGRLLGVWVLITAGLSAVFVSDVLFAYFTALDIAFVERFMDLLYAVGYVLLPRGILIQLHLLGASPAGAAPSGS